VINKERGEIKKTESNNIAVITTACDETELVPIELRHDPKQEIAFMFGR
jgi:hypothetical protein